MSESPIPILLVEDSQAEARLLVEYLGATGEPFQVTHVAQLGEALAQLSANAFAAVLLDLHMPGMDGYETAQFIRSRKRTARTFGAMCVNPECQQCFTVDTCQYWHWSKSKAMHERGTEHRVYYMNIAEKGVA